MEDTEVRAVLRYAHISSQKVRRVIDAVKGKPVQKGLEILKFMPQKSANILEKIVRDRKSVV